MWIFRCIKCILILILLAALKQGVFDVLVVILDVYEEGFSRSGKSLIQIVERVFYISDVFFFRRRFAPIYTDFRLHRCVGAALFRFASLYFISVLIYFPSDAGNNT